jgi:hypothetical protein
MSRRPKLADKEISQELEDMLLGTLDWCRWESGLNDGGNAWQLIVDLAFGQPDKPLSVGAPTKLDTGARDLLICLEMHMAVIEGKSVRKAADDLAALFRELDLYHVNGETLRQRYLLLGREGPTVSMLRAAKALWRSKQAGR